MTDLPASQTGTAAARYNALTPDREPFLNRARRMSALTVVSLFREQGSNGSTDAVLPWQAIGSAGVNNLAAKLTLGWFPPGTPFFKLKPDRKTIEGLNLMGRNERGDLLAAFQRGLSKVEMEFVDAMDEDGDRAILFDSVRRLLVGGNHGLKFLPDDTLQGLPLDTYVTLRDKQGSLLEAVIQDEVAYETADEDIQDLVRSAGYVEKPQAAKQECLKVYTHIKWKRGKWKVRQEVWGETVPGSERTYTWEALPFLFLRFISLAGEDYGRSYCEDLEADLTTVDAFWQMLTEGSANIAKLIWAVKPGGVTNKRILEQAPNGGIITGDVDDVGAIRSDKTADLQIAFNTAERVESRLEYAFLMNKAVQRSGERVTKEEIVTVRAQLEVVLAGAYANGAPALQVPYAKLKMSSYQRHGRVTPLPKDSVKMTLLTGEAALGRLLASQDEDEFLLGASTILGPEVIAPYIRIGNYLERRGANRAVDTDGLIRSQDEVDANNAQQAQQQLMQQVAPEVVKQGGEMMQNQQLAAQEAPAPQGA